MKRKKQIQDELKEMAPKLNELHSNKEPMFDPSFFKDMEREVLKKTIHKEQEAKVVKMRIKKYQWIATIAAIFVLFLVQTLWTSNQPINSFDQQLASIDAAEIYTYLETEIDDIYLDDLEASDDPLPFLEIEASEANSLLNEDDLSIDLNFDNL